MARTIIVFLNNKLITCDTVVPMMFDVASRNSKARFEFTTFEERTYHAVRQNTVLYDAITAIGRLTFRGRAAKDQGRLWPYLRHRIAAAVWLGGLLMRALAGNASLVHFKFLNGWPQRLLGLLAPHRVFYLEPTAVGYAPLEKRVSDLMFERTYRSATPVGRYVVGFSRHWPALSDDRLADRTRLRLNPPFSSNRWLQYLSQRSDDYLATAFASAGAHDPGPMALFILTWMGPSGLLAERELFPVLYEEALDVLAETCPELPLFLKPHPAMNDSERCWAIERARERVRLKVMPTDLHPMVLARRARFAIGLCYSTTFSMLRFMEVPTVEYTNYADHILAETDGGSMRPEFVTYYVNRDRKALARILRELSANSSRRVPSGTALLGDGPLLHALAGQS